MVLCIMNQPNPQELIEFASRVLYGTSFDEKLTPPSSNLLAGTQTLFNSNDFTVPALPGRPPGLELSSIPKKRQTHNFPGKSELSHDRARGQVLHFFANHELLALELMALAILKFSDAPAGFIRGIVQTMADEQRHMHQYLKRMKELGVEFGDAPLNGFFWQSLKDMQSPQEYAAAMSMTFEQANLDFSLHFEHEFERLGDHETAVIMNEVRRDEIGHVKHGAIWLDRWRDPAKSLWQEYVSHLRFPVTPARGKGPTFDRDGRRLAGLSDEFIDQCEVFSHSRGRPPKIFWFNPACEQEVAAQTHSINHARPFIEMTEDLAVLMMHLGYSDDTVLVHARPSIEWLAAMKHSGFELPEFVVGAADPQKALKDRNIGGIRPWGWSPSAEQKLKPLCKNLMSGAAIPPCSIWHTKPDGSSIFSKALAVGLRDEHDLKAYTCLSLDDINLALKEIVSQTSRAVIKAPIGSSGHNAIQVDAGIELDSKFANWCMKVIHQQKLVIVEPWVDRLADVSCQFEILPTGEIKILGFTRFLVNIRGTYKGHVFGKLLSGLSTEVHSAWHRAEDSWASRFENAAKRCGAELFAKGYHGPAGIDGFIYQSANGTPLFQSLGEINARYTMGRVALELSKHLISKQPGVWLHISQKDLKTAGFETFTEIAKHIESVAPLKLRKNSSSEILLESGALFTNDPAVAKQTLTVLWAGATYEDIQAAMLRKAIR